MSFNYIKTDISVFELFCNLILNPRCPISKIPTENVFGIPKNSVKPLQAPANKQ